ncbi:MAG TPA: PDZ domain-containing protein, partial [Planctomycetota bacterium]|nr:PDZ domain-containing protein [Planctomycetota bacterium]
GGAFAVAFHPSGRALVSGGADGALREWAVDGASGRVWEGDAGIVRSLAFSPDGRLLLSSGPAGAAVWDARTGRKVRALDPGGAGAVGAVFARGGREALVTALDGRVWTWGERGEAPGAGPSARPPGFLGVSYVDAGGAFIQQIFPGSQAERTGFRPGDLITGVDGLRIGRSDEFLEFMRRAREGDDLHVRIQRAGASRFIRVKLGRWEER